MRKRSHLGRSLERSRRPGGRSGACGEHRAHAAARAAFLWLGQGAEGIPERNVLRTMDGADRDLLRAVISATPGTEHRPAASLPQGLGARPVRAPPAKTRGAGKGDKRQPGLTCEGPLGSTRALEP